MTALVRGPVREVRNRIFDSARWAGYQAREGDVVICTYPKCGTTWTQRIVGMLLAGSAAPASVMGPWPDFRLGPPIEVTLGELEGMTGRRYIKSHVPYDSLPVYEGVKFIHVARDGRDSAMSFHNHMINFQPEMTEVANAVSRNDPKFGDALPQTPEDPAAYFRFWLSDGGAVGDPGASYWEMERSYWAARRDPNMLLVHYNDLKADRAGEIARIAKFIDVDLPAATMAEIVEAAGFEQMKKAGEALLPDAGMIWVGGSQTFLHKGTNGRWQGVCSAADLADYQRRVAEEFTPGLAAWLEGGRRTAGDPEASAD
ncbi:MAG TPA: sulfotransferase domain-containing protein [Caulobacteraceae bacterium]|nr:sulfotransferase domain-containing protein [Caulobacteraceae bacterium]